MRADLPVGTVTFLFTDIEGSTRLLHRLGASAYAAALADHRDALRAAFAAHGGAEVDTQGDAFFVAFPTAEGAVAAARAGTAALDSGPVRVRMGLHTGTPTVTAEGYVGGDVHLGARVSALAHGGQVLLTDATRALLPYETETLDLGLHRLQDVPGPTRVLQLGSSPFPPVRTPGAVDLPVPASRFVGRERELYEAIATWYEREPRALTVLGPGGAGKTRFAFELARLLAEEADGGTVFVALAPLRDPELVLPAVAERLGAASPDPEVVATRVADRRTHVLVDNVEQLLPAAAAPIAALLAAAPGLRLLVTSREPLQIAGETELDLPPLDEADGVALFLERAHAVRRDVVETPAVHELVRRLDGLPLALELAAARSKLLDPPRLLERLGEQLDLSGGSRDADERHATLRATIAWSYDLLDDRERTLFALLAVFRGEFTLELAEEVCGAELGTLGSLLDKSLVRRRTDADGGSLWMLETIAAFARERLSELPAHEEERVRRSHAVHVLEISRSAHLSSEDQGRARPDHARVLAVKEEIRAALDWSTTNDPPLAAEIVVALETYWVTSGIDEALRRVEALLEDDAVPPPLRARLLRLQGGQLLVRGEQRRGEESYQAALELFRELGDDDNVVALLARFSVNAGWGKTPDEARRLVDETRALNATVGNPIVEPQMLSTLADVARAEGDLETALELARESVAAATACDFELWMLWQRVWQLELEVELGLAADAERTGRAALELAMRLDDRLRARLVLVLVARAELAADPWRAGMLWGAVSQAERDEPLVPFGAWLAENGSPLTTCRDERFLAGAETGRLHTVAHVSRVVLDGAQTVP
jgi:predicted ATPase/class 3 adenylate cyclase